MLKKNYRVVRDVFGSAQLESVMSDEDITFFFALS